MTTYPITWPLPDKIRTRRITPDFNEAVFEGQFSRQEQIQSHSGGKSDRWIGLWGTTTLTPAEIAKAEVALWSLKGRLGTFYAYDPDRRLPNGQTGEGALWAGSSTDYAGASTTYAGAGLTGEIVTVNGAGQTGNTLAVTYDKVSATVGLAGDYIQVGVGFHALLVDAITNGSGNVTYEFQPNMRVSPGDGDIVVVTNAVMVARLDEQYKGSDTDETKTGVVAFAFHEDVA